MKYVFTSLVLALFLVSSAIAQAFNYLPYSRGTEIIQHTAFTLSYIEKYEQPEWVAYKLTRDMLSGPAKRTNKFIPDTLVTTGSATAKDYEKSGYDKGHLCPAADMKSSPVLMKECFYMSNMSPQDPAFNRGVWSKLEELVRTWAMQDSLLYIATGPVFRDSMKFIGKKNRVAVPWGFYKVILEYRKGYRPKAIGFILPNLGTGDSLIHFTASVDSVEKLTGIDFFPGLPDIIERRIERSFDLAEWNLVPVITKKDNSKTH
ncbi:MAG TPA: DNA/RNA non-specific endonuclease [Ignavibacteriales bacterium]|nr:DNA/RNA non-specific endonuclease [Ignavibacteriales bacterium]